MTRLIDDTLRSRPTCQQAHRLSLRCAAGTFVVGVGRKWLRQPPG